MAIPHDLVLIGGFIATEVAFSRLESWFHAHQELMKSLRHGTLVIWVFQPSVTAGIAHWVDHALTSLVLASNH